MKYEPIDALFLLAQPDAKRGVMFSHRAGLAAKRIDLFRAPAFVHRLLKLFDSRAVLNYSYAALNRAFGVFVLQRTTHRTSKPIRFSATIQPSSKVL